MSEVRLSARGLTKRFGGLAAVHDVTLDLWRGRIHAVIGPNGAGKSTLINMTCGVFPQDGGTMFKDGRQLGGAPASQALSRSLARTFQNVRVFATLSVLENVMVAFPEQPGDAPWRLFGKAWRDVEERNRAEAVRLLERVGLAGDAGRRADTIPFGSQKLLALVRATVTGADTLLLDETTTGLEMSRVPLVLDFLRDLRAAGRTVLLVEHNMDVVTGVADSVVVLHGTVIAQGTPQHVLHDEAVIRDYLGRIYSA
jgi:ABC-type branched-subunit amino acid transport system ATPase component